VADRGWRVGAAAAFVVLLPVVVASCTWGNDPRPRPVVSPTGTIGTLPTATTCRPTATVPPTNQLQDITYQGQQRTYVLSVPSGYDGTQSAPLIFDFYGRDGDATEQVADYELDDEATAAGMLVVTPQAADDRDPAKSSWAGDIELVPAILQSLEQRWCVDRSAIFTAGFSDGGVFSAYLACELPDLFAAVGTVAEVDYPPNCDPTRTAFSVIGFHGKGDPLVPFEGGSTDDLDGRSGLPGSPEDLPPSQPIEQTFADFARLDGCRDTPSSAAASSGVLHLVYGGCRDGLAVELYVLDDGGHEWPGDPGAGSAAPGSLDANHLMVQFFLAHERPAGPTGATAGTR
jgi:polyhydroxybutyrate depolymerase